MREGEEGKEGNLGGEKVEETVVGVPDYDSTKTAAAAETKTPPTHYFMTMPENGIDTFKIDAFDPNNMPKGEVTFMCVDATKEEPVQSIVDKDGNKIEQSIPDGLQDAVKKLLNEPKTDDASKENTIVNGLNAEIVTDTSTIKPNDGKKYYIVTAEKKVFEYNPDTKEKTDIEVPDSELKTKILKVAGVTLGGRRRSRRNRRQNGKRQSKKRQQKRQSKNKKQNGGKKRRNSKRNQKK